MEPADHGSQILGIELGRELRRAHHVDEYHREMAPLGRGICAVMAAGGVWTAGPAFRGAAIALSSRLRAPSAAMPIDRRSPSVGGRPAPPP